MKKHIVYFLAIIGMVSGFMILCSLLAGDFMFSFIFTIVWVAVMFSIYAPSRLGWWNWAICQWFFFRICISTDDKTGVIDGKGILFPIIPLTGWDFPISSDFYPKKFKRFIVWVK